MIPAKSKSIHTIVKKSNSLFHLQTNEHDSEVLTPYIIKEARRSGELTLSGKGLGTVPPVIWTLRYHKERKKFHDRGDYIQQYEFVPLSVLNLSSNVLHKISPEIGNLQDLIVLHLQDNNIENLPHEIDSLQKLEELNLHHNKLTNLPSSLYSLKNLRHLNLSHNNLETINEQLGYLTLLEFLDLSYNCLLYIPYSTGDLIRLKYLNIARNDLVDIRADLSKLLELRTINASHNNLKTFSTLGGLPTLEKLYLQGNLLTSVPNLKGCFAIEELHLSFNEICDVTLEALETVTSLKVLLLRNNRINTLPGEISMLQNLNWLDLSNNNLTEVPESLGFLPQLRNLQLEGNHLKNIHEDMLKRSTETLLMQLRSRSESMAKFRKSGEIRVSDIKLDKTNMMKTHILNLSMKGLKDVIPVNVFQDAAELEVTIVDLSKNSLEFFPDELTLLSERLKEVNLSYNLLSKISPKIAECLNLKCLNLEKNVLYDLPTELGTLKYLRELVISYNRFNFIPECVFELEKLEILLVRGNHITEIDLCGFSRLTKLSILDLADNDIEHVPVELGNLTQLTSLGLRGNKFHQPRHAVLEKGTEYLLSYLRDRIP